jgi:glycosyltransferase involved in cell wall biosynthesis
MIQNIFFIIPDLRCGGAEKVFINLANYYSKNYSIKFIVLEKKGELIGDLNADIEIISLDSTRLRFSIFKLIKIFKIIKNSYVISAMWPLNCIVMLSSLFAPKSNKFFLTEHVNLSSSIGIDFHSSKVLLFLSVSFTYFLSNKIICVSEGVKKDLHKFYFFNKKKLVTIYNPIIHMIKNDNKKNQKSKINILSVGTLKVQKDHITLLRAFSLLKNKSKFHLNIVGDGPLKNQLIKLSKNLKIQKYVTFHGFQKLTDKFYNKNDIFILSSIYEGFGNVLVEALSFGLKIISTDCPNGPSEILCKGKYGILVPIKQPQKITQAIYDIQDIEYDQKSLKLRSNDFKIDIIANKYLKIMQSS